MPIRTGTFIVAGLLWTCLLTPRSWAAPSAVTLPPVDINPNAATLEATVNPGGAVTSVYFQYGTTTNYGSLTATSNIGSGTITLSVSNTVAGLMAGTTYHYRVVATNLAGIGLGGDLSFTPPVFTLTNTGLPAMAGGCVAWGDSSNDGKLDLLLTGTDSGFNPSSQLWQNQGNYGFTEVSSGLPLLPQVSSSAAAWGDFDNDGHPGFALTGYAGLDANNFPIFVSQIWRNEGNGTFSNLNTGLPKVDTGSVAWGDFENSGKLDLLLTGYMSTGGVAQIWRNLGNDTFTNINAGFPGLFYSSVAVGDFDNDGRLDVLLTGTTNGFVSGAVTEIWRNLGNGVFTNINANLPGVYRGSVAVGDFYNSGRLDLLLTGYTATGAVAQVWRNLGNDTFTNINAGLPGVSESSIAVGDFDNDGNLDILLSGMDAQTNLVCQVWRNLGGGVFTNINAGLSGIQSGSVAWADFDNDGRLDILLTGYGTNNTPLCNVYHNNTPLANTLQPRLAISATSTNGPFNFSFKGKTGEPYLISASTNGVHWDTIGAPHESSTGTFQFYDFASAPYSSRIYRASAP